MNTPCALWNSMAFITGLYECTRFERDDFFFFVQKKEETKNKEREREKHSNNKSAVSFEHDSREQFSPEQV